MPFTKQGPFSFRHSDQQDDLYKVYSASEIKQKFDSQPAEVRTALNNLIDALVSSVASDSGAHNVGSAPITGLAGDKVHSQIQDLYQQLQTAINNRYSKTEADALFDTITNVNLKLSSKANKTDVLEKTNTTSFTPSAQFHPATKKYVDDTVAGVTMGQVADGSITDAKLSNNEGQIKQTVAAHLADNANPHSVTKAQVGLGNVENYSIATKNDAESGIASDKYMTPLRTKEAIQALVPSQDLSAYARKQQENWIAPTLLNGWQNFGPLPDEPAGYFKDEFGNVHIRGNVKNGTIGLPMFNLPVGYRPLGIKRFTVASNNGSSVLIGHIQINADGNVFANNGTGTAWVTLTPIIFRAE